MASTRINRRSDKHESGFYLPRAPNLGKSPLYLSCFPMASANMQESQNPKPLAEGIAGEPPRQLASSVGNLLALGASSATPSASSTWGDPICFGFFEFAPHES